MTKAILHIDALPCDGETLDLGEHIITTKNDYDLGTMRNLELLLDRDALAIEVEALVTHTDAVDAMLVDAHKQSQEATDAIDQAKVLRTERDKALYDLRLEQTRAIKSEKEAANYLQVNKNRSERVERLTKQVKQLEGQIKTYKKQLDDARKKHERGYVDPKNLTINLDKRLIIQLNSDQIHIHDPASCYVVSSQPLPSEEDYAPRFVGYPYPALLDQHDDLRARIETSVSQLAMEYRKRAGKVLTADLRGDTTVPMRKKLWNAGVMFVSELDDPKVIEKVKALPGIGEKTLERILKAAKQAVK